MNLNQDDHIDWDEFVQAMTEKNIYRSNLNAQGYLPLIALTSYSASPAWSYAIDPEDYGSLDWGMFEDAMIIVKQFEYVASDTIANSGIVDASLLATQVFAENYDYALMEAVNPSAEDNVDFEMWVTSIAETITLNAAITDEYSEVRAFNQTESIFDTDEQFYQCDIDKDELCSPEEWSNSLIAKVKYDFYVDGSSIAVADLAADFTADEITLMDFDADDEVSVSEWFDYQTAKNEFATISEGEVTFTFD